MSRDANPAGAVRTTAINQPGRRALAWPAAFLCSLLLSISASAHPIPREVYDRTIVVRLQPDPAAAAVILRVQYRLELDEFTAVRDIRLFADDIDFDKGRKSPLHFYGEFTRLYAPVLAGNLRVQANGKKLSLTRVKQEPSLHDENGQALGHLRCDFEFEARFPLAADNTLEFVDDNFPTKEGKIDLTLSRSDGLRIKKESVPDKHLRDLAPVERRPGDEDRLRRLSAVFRVVGPSAVQTTEAPANRTTDESEPDHDSLTHLFLQSESGLWLLLLAAAAIGAVHALTPGHGKTLVAAYLVGRHGTITHALVLGLVTTMTHTGVVLLLAVLLQFVSQEAARSISAGLGLIMGLLVACLGFWLLLQRLSGRADHVHLGGGHHHHGHHHHPDHGTIHPPVVNGERVTWWGLIVLGMSGGIVPCWDAIAMFVLAVASNQVELALPMLLAFSAGLAGVLVAIGILVVQVRNFAGSHWGEGKLVRALPIVSALFVTAMGLWICYDSVKVAPH
jgi:nickel/cobalt exporter